MLQEEDTDQYFMQEALKEARKAFDAEEVPIGAVVVSEGRIIGRGYNQVERLRDATAHAEMIAITAACDYLGTKYLPECTLYVTIEPCVMCAGALRWVQMKRVVYGASEPKYGHTRIPENLLHPKTERVHGILEQECADLMIRFFRARR